jgi:GT2 family glycosyltransferase
LLLEALARAIRATAMTAGREPADVTVAVATCGRPAALARCLAALENGSVLPLELIVVDQAQSAQAYEAVGACPRLHGRYLTQPRLGLSASRNLALAEATRRILAVTDDDCAPDHGWVAAIAAAFARAPEPAAVTGPILPLGPRPAGGHAVSLRSLAAARDFRGRLVPWDVGSGANFAAPRSLLLEQGGWDERLGVGSPGQAAEDAELLYRLLSGGGLVRYDPAVVVHHEWQTWTRRLQTRSSYAHGVGALCGLRLRARDPYALRMLAAFARLHARPLAAAAWRRDRAAATEHALALAAVAPGVLYGLRARRQAGPTGARRS